MIVNIKIEKLFPHPQNPRKNIGDVEELANSIKESGIFQNLTVVEGGAGVPAGDSGYTVIIGHRRLAASKLAGLTELPCAIVKMTEKEQIATMLLENMQRSDLTLIEQAQGFQMMLDLGDTHEEIAQKTGFAVSTIKKRLKINLLDVDSLKKRDGDAQLTMEDYIKISEIKDKKEQASLIAIAGTSSFNWQYKSALEKQKRKELLPDIKKELKSLAKQGKDGDHWNNKYETVVEIEIEKFKPGVFRKAAEKLDAKVLEKCVWEITMYWAYLLKPASKKKAEKAKKSKAEIEADKLRDALEKLHTRAYELRKEFILNFNASKKYKDVIYQHLLNAVIYRHDMNWTPTFNAEVINKLTGGNGGKWNITAVKVMDMLKQSPSNTPALLTWAEYGDNEDLHCFDYSYGANKPKYKENVHLKRVYAFLQDIGYQVSSEEQMMLDGTQPIYKGKLE